MNRHAAAALLCLAGCAVSPIASAAAAQVADWRWLATSPDRTRMRRWREAWNAALAVAGPAVVAYGAVLDRDGALPGAVPPVGDYRCRLLRLGREAGVRDFPWGACRVAATSHGPGEGQGQVTLAQLSGPQRHAGVIFPAEGARAAFLGTVTLGDERRPFVYGRDAARDAAGWTERIGAAQWRVALPYPAFGASLDVLELQPR